MTGNYQIMQIFHPTLITVIQSTHDPLRTILITEIKFQTDWSPRKYRSRLVNGNWDTIWGTKNLFHSKSSRSSTWYHTQATNRIIRSTTSPSFSSNIPWNLINTSTFFAWVTVLNRNWEGNASLPDGEKSFFKVSVDSKISVHTIILLGILELISFYPTVHAAGALMHSIDVDIVPQDECRQRLQGAESQIPIDDTLTCVKAHKQRNNLCQVDVGGPLACDRGDGFYELTGIYSQDTGCLPTNQVRMQKTFFMSH